MRLDEFVDYLKNERKKSTNTLEAYKRDIVGFFEFLKKSGIDEPDNITNTNVVAYLLDLKEK